MRATLLTPILAAALLSLTACDFEDIGNGSRYSSDFHYNYPLKAGGRLEVDTFNGAVEISGWDQSTVDISGTKYGSTQDSADSIRVNVDHSTDSILIRAVRSLEHRNQSVRFTIMVPRDVVLDRINTSNGAIRVKEVGGPARLNTSNGKIQAEEIRGPINASTSNGSIDISLLPDYQGDLHANTSNGGITVRASTEPNARLSARTSNGSVKSDFDVRVQGELTRNHMEGILGHGGGVMDLHTSNGSIRIERR